MQRGICLVLVGFTVGAGCVALTPSEKNAHFLYDWMNSMMPKGSSGPSGSLSERVLEKLHSGVYPSRSPMVGEDKREEMDEHIKSQVVSLLGHLNDCKENPNEYPSLGQCMIENYGMHVRVGPSSIGTGSGDGSFVRSSTNSDLSGDVKAFQVVTIYEGDLISPWKQWVNLLTGKELENGWLLNRYCDGYILDGKPYGSEGAAYKLFKENFCENSISAGQLINHPPLDIQPNVAFYHISFSGDDEEFDNVDNMTRDVLGSKYKKEGKLRVSVAVSLRDIEEDSELFVDYGFLPIYHWPANEFEQPKIMFPDWYHPTKRVVQQDEKNNTSPDI